jgi:mannosyl-3-phosphoglycerate phosphatase
LRPSTNVLYCAIDSFLSPTNRAVPGFAEFLGAVSEAELPCVWITSRSRIQLDQAIRKFGNSDPFIAEGGSGAYIPEDYFHLKPERTIRRARFTCIPAAAPLPAAAEALESLAEETGVAVVPLHTLTPRELSQNTGLAPREAALLAERDFDEYFFFAGASEADLARFRLQAKSRNLLLRPRGTLWSLAVGANLETCVSELSKLYDRAFKSRSFRVALATSEDAAELFPTSDRTILLTAKEIDPAQASRTFSAHISLPLGAADTWASALDAVQARRS